MQKIPRVVVAGLRGGSGKTTLSVGLAAALVRRGLRVVPFKKGPDYIDSGWLAAAAGSECYNLDPYLAGDSRASFVSHAQGADMAVIEGNRGLFDGMDAQGSLSTSRLARDLKAPLILIMDVTKSTRTNAAVALGAKQFERGLQLAGVVLNNVAGKRHESVTRQAIEKLARVPVLGAIPRLNGGVDMPERHMGLTPRQEHSSVEKAIAAAAEIIESHVDLDRIIRLARRAPALKGGRVSAGNVGNAAPANGLEIAGAAPTIGVIRDSAFQFYYPENMEALAHQGANLVEVSALTERELPEMDALYIGGGFPETHALELGRNLAFMKSLREAVERGLPVYAECGGLMYLGDTIELMGRKYKMSSVLPARFSMHAKPHAHGYTEMSVAGKNPFYKTRTVLRGHEFHYSEVTNAEDLASNRDIGLVLRVRRGKGIIRNLEGITYKNVFATYTHTHALGTPSWAGGMVRAALKYRKSRP